MKLEDDIELLESFFVELDPLTDGLVGVLVEVHRRGDRYVLWRRPSLLATGSAGSPRRTGGWSTPPSPGS